MANETRISSLDAADTTLLAEVAATQLIGGERVSRRFPLGSAATRVVGSGAGEVPLLGSNGALPLGQGGTGLAEASPGASKVFATDSLGTPVWIDQSSISGGGGGGGNVSFASEAETLAGTINNKAVTPLGLHDVILNVEQALGQTFADWTAETDNTAVSLTDGELFGGDVPVNNASGKNAQSRSIAAQSFAIFGPLCAGLPAPTSGTLAWALGFDDGAAGTRWLLVNTTAGGYEFFRLAGSSWISAGTTGDALTPSYYGLPNDGYYRPLSTQAHGAPRDPALPFIARRSGQSLDAAMLTYNASPLSFNLHRTSRAVQFLLADGQVETASIADGAITNAKVSSTAAIELSKLNITGTPAAGKLLGATGAATFGWVDPPSASVGDASITTAKLANGAVTLPKLDAALFASEAELIQAPATTKLATAAAVAGLYAEIDRQLGEQWTTWTAVARTDVTTLTDGATLTITGLTGGLLVRNVSTFNMKTSAISAGQIIYAGTLCADPPTGVGTLRGVLLFEDASGTRWAVPVDNPEGPDSRQFFYLDSSNDWQPQAYNGDLLLNNYGAMLDDARWFPLKAFALNGPGATISDGPAVGLRSGTAQTALRANYSTADNRHEFYVSTRSFEITLSAGQVRTANIANAAVTGVKIANDAIDYQHFNIATDPTDGQVLTASVSGGTITLDWGTFTGGGGGVPGPGTLTFAMFAAATIATEQDVFDAPSSNTSIVANKTLYDAIQEIDRQLDLSWGSWGATQTTTRTSISSVATGTIPFAASNSGIINRNIGIRERNSSSFNATTETFATDILYVLGPNCTGMPSLSSGTLRGGFMFRDGSDVRWFYPIDNPEGPDSEEFFWLDGTTWRAVDYKGDRLATDYKGLPDNDRWTPFAAHARGQPSGTPFGSETAIARRDGSRVQIVRATYDTIDNEFDFFASYRDNLAGNVADNVITEAKLAVGGGSDGQVLIYSTSSFGGMRWGAAPLPGTSTITASMLQDGIVTTSKIGSDAVETSKIKDNAVTRDKIPDDAISRPKILADAIDSSKLADDAVGLEHLNTSNTGTANQFLQRTASGLQWADSSGGGGGGLSLVSDALWEDWVGGTNGHILRMNPPSDASEENSDGIISTSRNFGILRRRTSQGSITAAIPTTDSSNAATSNYPLRIKTGGTAGTHYVSSTGTYIGGWYMRGASNRYYFLGAYNVSGTTTQKLFVRTHPSTTWSEVAAGNALFVDDPRTIPEDGNWHPIARNSSHIPSVHSTLIHFARRIGRMLLIGRQTWQGAYFGIRLWARRTLIGLDTTMWLFSSVPPNVPSSGNLVWYGDEKVFGGGIENLAKRFIHSVFGYGPVHESHPLTTTEPTSGRSVKLGVTSSSLYAVPYDFFLGKGTNSNSGSDLRHASSTSSIAMIIFPAIPTTSSFTPGPSPAVIV